MAWLCLIRQISTASTVYIFFIYLFFKLLCRQYLYKPHLSNLSFHFPNSLLLLPSSSSSSYLMNLLTSKNSNSSSLQLQAALLIIILNLIS